MSQTPFILVDGSSYLFRAYHAMPPLTNAEGLGTGAIYGVVNMLKKMQDDCPGATIVVVFDPKGKTQRHDLFPAYKANRGAMPEELAEQIPPLHALITALGFPLVIKDGIEADDVIGTLAHQASSAGQSVLISTGDKDMAQLVNGRVQLINTMTSTLLDTAGVIEKFGVRPDQMIDYLALMGDQSDNIPGIPKVGPKTAAKWIGEYGSLDNIVAQAAHIGGKVGEHLRANLDQLALSRQLVTIDCDIALPVQWDALTMAAEDAAQLALLYQRLGFSKWLAALDAPVTPPSVCEQYVPAEYETVLTVAQLEAWITRCEQAPYFALDTETTGLDPRDAELVGIALATAAGQAAYIPLQHTYEGAPEQLSWALVSAKLAPLLTNPAQTVIGHHLKFDYQILKRAGLTIAAQCRDTLLASYVLYGTQQRHDLDRLVAQHLGHQNISYASIVGEGKTQQTWDAIALEQATPYAAEDADMTLRLYHVLEKQWQDKPALQAILTELEWPLITILAEMEWRGVCIDAEVLGQQSQVLRSQLSDLEQTIFSLSGEAFNIDSTKQLREVLYERLSLPVLKKTASGVPSTAEEVLQQLSVDYPLPAHILSYRSARKLLSTYTEKLPTQIHPDTGRVHTTYVQTGTSTGRLASKSPNLQNIPIRTEQGRAIRQAFVVPSGCCLVAADYSQVELRIMAHLSQDPGLMTAFEQDLDVHAQTAADIFHVALDAVTPDQRRSAKAINFGLLYGMSSFGLAKQLQIGRAEAEAYIARYFSSYPGVQAYMDSIRSLAADNGYVETLLGRRLTIPDIRSKQVMRRKAAERAAINAPLQGTAADMIKRAMIGVQRALDVSAVSARMIMQVHDELVFEVEEGSLAPALEIIKTSMCSAVSLNVPLRVDIGVGSSWEEAH